MISSEFNTHEGSDAYETLRQEALERNPQGHRGQGLALFLARGMTAWLEVLHTFSPPSIPSRPSKEVPCAPPVPLLLKNEVTLILASMVLSCHPEVMR